MPSASASPRTPRAHRGSGTGRRFRLEGRGPYSFAASARFLEGFAPAAQESSAGGDHLHWAFTVEGGEDVAGVCLRGREGRVSGEIFGAPDAAVVRRQVERILSLDVDGKRFPAVGRGDPVVGELQRRYRGLRPVCFFSPYEAAAWALISHRIRIRQAASTRARMARELGESIEIHGEVVRAFPSAARLRRLGRFRGLSERKLANLRALAEATETGVLDADRLRGIPPEQALEELQVLPGIGDFSAELVLLRGAGEPDYVALHEPRLPRAVALAYELGQAPEAETLTELAERWRPYRTWVSFLLRVSFEDETHEISGGPGRSS